MLSHTTLANYYHSVFNLAQHHGYGIEDIEKLLPYERDLYMEMLIAHLEEVKQKADAAKRR
jgi:hypothetical protein